ncbi:hypothetical protein M409DRAFT_36796 [Zasmidium cellare ATCC 36951]|uniref:C2H2-type domain-containing protein n=1 Tax=Zasmidium cellare ATCC 36951 TaxID=1080233 RepID=A0A6A6CFL8_ZASCE|nr:uncharacterized protein M409DRAFT_36796 [Zasmidium cellare ATCC 36951]KAF2166027.1 hypothetical protein M409DRAFT_36796 [Zasmidium cellare ATCC 36951]
MSLISSFVGVRDQASQQPFECSICQRGFTRRENLKRHSSIHLPNPQSNKFPCEWCPASFSRGDLRQRHVKKKHLDAGQKPLGRLHRSNSRQNAAWDNDAASHASSSASPATIPDSWHSSSGQRDDEMDLVLQQSSTVESFDDEDFRHKMSGAAHGIDQSIAQVKWFPTRSQISNGYNLYFEYVSPFIPFLHRPTFDASLVAPHLTLSMLSLAYQYGEDPDRDAMSGTGADLSLRCFEQARNYLGPMALASNNPSVDLSVVQSLLMLQLCAILYICGDYSCIGFELHHRMVSFARAAGLMQPSNTESTTTEDLDSLWHEFAASESLKRTILTAHQVDALWYQFLSIPRLVSNPEIKHDLPCPAECWMASSAQQWAHRQLVLGAAKVKYGDAVRAFLAPNPEIDSLPSFDPCGAINIAQFMLSSARELSGWTIMTGRLSLERFEPLKSSLVALEPFVRSSPTSQCCQSISSLAAWEMTMIELPVWWISHTNGVVLGSMDVFLEHATFIATSSEFCSESETAHSIKPHIEWFLRYLDNDVLPTSEPPWLILYAYKAFLIAWQLLDRGLPNAMEAVGVEAGNRVEALRWADGVFGRRRPRRLVEVILKCLGALNG